MPGFGAPPDSAAPSDFDYDMWLGPAPKRPLTIHRGIYHFRWFWDYSGGQMTNLGAHSIDIVQWYLDLKGPSRVCSFGGRRAFEDNGETPDVQDAIFEYANGVNLTYSIREVSAGSRAGSALEFFGTKGSLTIERPMLKITLRYEERSGKRYSAIQRTQRGRPSAGRQEARTLDGSLQDEGLL